MLGEPAPNYVGRAQCVACHAEQDARWTGSNHDLAMQEATQASVLGDFNDAAFDWFGVTSRFYRQDGRFMVRTDGPDGRMQDYPIKYTFGVAPLQQYLIEFPGGRLQALDIGWDSRPREAGGQRWLHLHPQDQVAAGDVLHWTGPNLNWNYMCADCHSTNLRKGYDPGSGSYHTTWSEIDVSCEACHGPGSVHVSWAEQKARGEPAEAPDMGLTVRLNERTGVAWTIDPVTGRPSRSEPRQSDREIQVCARCHSRRSQLTDQAAAGQPLLDAFRPALLTEGLYYPDGQIQDEVYEWGSFLQSKMHQVGVTCSDCHDPHSRQNPPAGGTWSAPRPRPGAQPAKAHHFHPEGSPSASCIACHMPTHQLHGRARLATTTACASPARTCRWPWAPPTPATAVTPTRRPNGPLSRSMPGTATPPAAGRAMVRPWLPPAPACRGPTACRGGHRRTRDAGHRPGHGPPGPGGLPQPRVAGTDPGRLQSGDPLERLGALNGLDALGPRAAALAIAPLWDDLRVIRIEAARGLAALPQAQVPEAVRERLAAGIDEYVAAQAFNAERPETQVNLAGLYADLKRPGEAEAAYREAIRLQPDFIPAYANLAQFMSSAGRETEAEGVLRSGLDRHPQAAAQPTPWPTPWGCPWYVRSGWTMPCPSWQTPPARTRTTPDTPMCTPLHSSPPAGWTRPWECSPWLPNATRATPRSCSP